LDELLLAYYTLLIVAEFGFSDEMEALFGLAPYVVEAISA
jgi:hypothetical protein